MKPGDLISWLKVQKLFDYDDQIKDRIEIIISGCSSGIRNHLGRDLCYKHTTEYYNGLHDTQLSPNIRPVEAIVNLWVDRTRKFEESSLIDPASYTLLDNDIFSASLDVLGKKIIKLEYRGGYIPPIYEQENEPISPVEGDYWFDLQTYTLKLYESAQWVASDLPKMPDDIEAAVAEYVSWAYNRDSSQLVGVTTKSTPAGQTNFEKMMPLSVKNKLFQYKVYL